VSVVLDTGVVVALMFPDDRHHHAAVRLVAQASDELVTTPLALAEMDHLALARVGRHAQEALWDDFERGAFAVRWWADGLRDTLAVARTRPHLGLTDASLVALAERQRTNRIATFDHRHFRTVADRDGQPFMLLPADGLDTA
jgi:predicted nucleic acid-binding protein